jgi:hypothetical protein
MTSKSSSSDKGKAANNGAGSKPATSEDTENAAEKAAEKSADSDPSSEPDWADGLRSLYDSVVEEDIPDSFKELLSKLDDEG